MADVKFNLKPWVDVVKLMAVDGAARRKIYKQWAARFRSFLQLRFDRFSKGGGNWPPLKKATVRRRRKGGRAQGVRQKTTMLRDTNTMFEALEARFTNKPGALEKMVKDGIRVGFGGPAKHPKAPATVADLARFHDKGEGNLPRRRIIVPPNRKTKEGMASDVTRGWKRIAK